MEVRVVRRALDLQLLAVTPGNDHQPGAVVDEMGGGEARRELVSIASSPMPQSEAGSAALSQ